MKKLLLTLAISGIGSSLFAQGYQHGFNRENTTRKASVTALLADGSSSEQRKADTEDQTAYGLALTGPEESNASNNKKGKSGSSGKYTTGIGIRFGNWESGLTVKHFFKGNAAIEGILSSGWAHRGTRITGLYEVQKPLGNEGFSWFWGVGAHIGIYNERYWNKGDCKDGGYEYNGRWYDCDGSRTTIGIDGIIGLEYLFQEIPITVGLDFKPSIDIFGWADRYGDAAFTVRYVF